MKKDHTRAPLVEAIQAFNASGITEFTCPGHKRGRGLIGDGSAPGLGAEVYLEDISMLNGADDRRESKDVQGRAEELAAEAMGADESYFSTNGSSLSAHVAEWATRTKPREVVPLPHHRELGTELVMRPTEAFFARTRKVKLEEAAGEIIAEMVSPYPPGIPRLIPGERVTETIVDYLRKGRDAGMFVLDPSDTELKTLRVVASQKE